MAGTTATTAAAAVHGLGVEANISDPEYLEMDKGLCTLAQDANGSDTYSNEKAMVGHMESKYYLVIDRETDTATVAANEIKVDLIKLGGKGGINLYLANDPVKVAHTNAHTYLSRFNAVTESTSRKIWITKIAALNYIQLREAGLKAKSAFIMAALRARWVATGAYGVAKEDLAATYNEIKIVDNTDTLFGRVVTANSARAIMSAMGKYSKEFHGVYKDQKHGMAWVTRHAENIFAAVEHCFRVRNHHFKNLKDFIASFTDLYMRFLEAAYEGEFEWPDGVDAYDVFRLAIHPFKLKALPVMMAHYTAHGKVANAAITRTSGSPCGCATITTTVAALDTMRSEAWWPSFRNAYGDTIDEAESYAAQINSNKYAYHISAGLYGLAKETTLKKGKVEISVEDAKSRVSLLASACQGMINALENAKEATLIKKYALANAKALVKPAAANPLLCLRISMLVGKALGEIGDAVDMKAAISMALPQLEKAAADAIAEAPAS